MKLLILAYYYPPLGGAGVQRTVKFARYLPDFGVKPFVVGGDGRDERDFVVDSQLGREVAHVGHVPIRLTTQEEVLEKRGRSGWGRRVPGMRFRGWCKAAERMMEQQICRDKPDALMVSASPFESVPVVARLARRHHLPWVLDLRDPWALDPIMIYTSVLHYWLDKNAMRRACHEADAVVMNTPGSLGAMLEAFPEVDSDKCAVITNGYDATDVPSTDAGKDKVASGGPVHIVHTGVFHTQLALKSDPASRKVWGLPPTGIAQRLLCRPGQPHMLARTPYYLLAAVRNLIDGGQMTPDQIKFTFVGADTPFDHQLVERFDLTSCVEFTGYVNHSESVNYLRQADWLFLPLHVAKHGSPLIVPGKLYEYLAVETPILGLVPEGDAADFLRQSGKALLAHPTDIDAIGRTLLKMLHGHNNGFSHEIAADRQFIRQFERRRLTEQLAHILSGLGARDAKVQTVPDGDRTPAAQTAS